jgi:hypothetical protein
MVMYEAPTITELGSVANLTQGGRPNEEFDGWEGFPDILGPETS